jgi:hypothetical protein
MSNGDIAMLGTEFGSYSSPQIDRESDLLREIERLRAALIEAEYFFSEDFPDGVDGPCAVTPRYREAYRAICAVLNHQKE